MGRIRIGKKGKSVFPPSAFTKINHATPIPKGGTTMTALTRIRWQHRLKLQSIQIEETLKKWGLNGRISGGHIHHPWTTFTFDKPPFPILGQLDTDALRHDLQQDLGVPVAQWQQQDSSLTLAIQQPVIPVPLLTMMIDSPENVLHETPLGCTERQTTLTWRLTHPHSNHVVATGAPGAGTADLLLSQGMALAWTHPPQQMRLLLLDGSEETPSPLAPLLDLPHTIKLAQGETAVKLLHALLQRCLRGQFPATPLPLANSQRSNDRQATPTNGHSPTTPHGHRPTSGSDHNAPNGNDHHPTNGNGRHHHAPNGQQTAQPATTLPATRHLLQPTAVPRLVIICHRLDRLLAEQPALANLLPWLFGHPSTGSGQDTPINLLASVRPPAFACWPVLAHVPLRLVGCVPDQVTAAYLTGQPHSQAERLLGGGDFLAIAPGLFTHFQAASLDRYDWAFCLEQLGGNLPANGSPAAHGGPEVAAKPEASSRPAARPLAVRQV
jgi:hypothetical protein